MSGPSREHPVRGRCLCGGVRYEITQPFQRAGYCQCSRCRKVTGAMAALNGRVARAGFRLLAGEELLTVYHPADDAPPALFCRTCGSSMFRCWWPPTEWVGIRLGTLDDDPGIRPQYRLFVDSRAPWDELPDDGLPRFPERQANA